MAHARGGPRPHSPARPPKFGCGEDEEDGDESGAACSPDDAARGGTQCGGEVVSSLRSRATQVHREGGSRHFAFGAIRLNGAEEQAEACAAQRVVLAHGLRQGVYQDKTATPDRHKALAMAHTCFGRLSWELPSEGIALATTVELRASSGEQKRSGTLRI